MRKGLAMKVKMLSTAAGPDGVWARHSEQDLPAAVALDLVRSGHAILVASTSLASVDVPETPEAGMTAGSRRKKNAP